MSTKSKQPETVQLFRSLQPSSSYNNGRGIERTTSTFDMYKIQSWIGVIFLIYGLLFILSLFIKSIAWFSSKSRKKRPMIYRSYNENRKSKYVYDRSLAGKEVSKSDYYNLI